MKTAASFYDATALRILVHGVIVTIVVGVAVTLAPQFGLLRGIAGWATPLVVGLSLDQAWELFSPDPQSQSILFEARLDFADGTSERWQPPYGGPLLGQYRGARWVKWGGRIPLRQSKPQWDGVARAFAHRYADDPRGLRGVVLIVRTAEVPADVTAPRSWVVSEFFRLDAQDVPQSGTPRGS